MLGGALGLATANHKQLLNPNSPIDLEAWRDALLQSTKNQDDSSIDLMEGSSDVSGPGSLGAINLSSRPSSVPSGQTLTHSSSSNNNNNNDVESRDDTISKNNSERDSSLNNEDTGLTFGNGKASPIPFLPPGLQQMQQLLQSQLAVFNPAQFQQLMSQQQQHILSHHQQQLADASRKQLEQIMHQLQEQLQVNVLHQSHLLQAGDKSSPKTQSALHQFQIQQQQLISQLQLLQQRIQLLPNFQRKEDFSDRNWKENAREHLQKTLAHKNGEIGSKSSEEKDDLRSNSNNNSNANRPNSLPDAMEKIGMQHPLFNNGVCQWPGCESNFNDLVSFLKHVGSEHLLDDRTTAQVRVQMQIVTQLEHSLHKERDRLQAMMAHLHLTKELQLKTKNAGENEKNPGVVTNNAKSTSNDKSNDNVQNEPINLPPQISQFNERVKQSPPKLRIPPGLAHHHGGPPHPASGLAAAMQSFGHLPLSAGIPAGMGLHSNTPLSALSATARSPGGQGLQPPMSPMGPPVRRRLSDKTPMPISNGLPYLFDRAGLDIAQEIHRNREFYRTHDVRPPFTYASLIRQAVVESADKQLTLHEIYNWFTTTFAYFRRNQASWKNAVRHNLSLHKCFMRVENVKGAVWTVDEVEYHRRRPQRGAAAGVHSKSPSFGHSPSMYSDALNASLQSALGFGEGPLPFMGQNLAEASMFHHRERHQQDQGEKDQFKDSSKFSDARQFTSPGSLHSVGSPGEHNNNNSDLDLKGDDLEVSARRLSRKRALDLYDDVDEDLNYDDEIIDDDSMQNDDISATDMSSEKRNSYRHHEHDVDSSDDKDKNDDADGEYVRRHTMDGHQDLHPQEAKMRSTKKDSF